MQLFVRNRRPTASLSTPLYLSVSAIREPSLGEYLSDIENSPLETARPELPIRARSAKISTLRDRLSSANIRKYRERFRYMEGRYGDGTGWLPQKDSNSQMSNSNPVSDAKTRKSGRKSGNGPRLVGFTPKLTSAHCGQMSAMCPQRMESSRGRAAYAVTPRSTDGGTFVPRWDRIGD